MSISTTPIASKEAAGLALGKITSLIANADALLAGDANSAGWQPTRTFSYESEISNKPLEVRTAVNKKLRGNHWNKRYNTGPRKLADILDRYLVGSLEPDLKILNKSSHVAYEKQWVKELEDFKLKLVDVPDHNPSNDYKTLTYAAQIQYHFPFLIKDRVFYELVHIMIPVDPESSGSRYVIQLPIKPEGFFTKEEREAANGRVPAHYTAVEKYFLRPVSSNTADGTAERETFWEMATSADPGGLIPLCLAHWGMDKTIAKDVGNILNFAAKE